MGEVYRAHDTRLNRDVAVKVLPEHLTTDPAALARFESEAKAVAALSHPNILVLHDFGSQDGTTWAVTELLEGETLRERLDRGALPWRKTVEIGAAVAEGLAAAHAKGITHRDIKPANIFLTADGRVKILDFGLAVQRLELKPDDETVQYVTGDSGTISGTVGYMSPEQLPGAGLRRAFVFPRLHQVGSGPGQPARRTAFSGFSSQDEVSAVAFSTRAVSPAGSPSHEILTQKIPPKIRLTCR